MQFIGKVQFIVQETLNSISRTEKEIKIVTEKQLGTYAQVYDKICDKGWKGILFLITFVLFFIKEIYTLETGLAQYDVAQLLCKHFGGRDKCPEFEVILVYVVNSRTGRAPQWRNPVSKRQISQSDKHGLIKSVSGLRVTELSFTSSL